LHNHTVTELLKIGKYKTTVACFLDSQCTLKTSKLMLNDMLQTVKDKKCRRITKNKKLTNNF